MKLLIRYRENIYIPILRIKFLTVMNLSGTVKISVIVKFIYGIQNTPYHPPKLLVLQLAGQLKKLLEYDLLRVHGVMLKESNQEIYQLLAVISPRSRVLCIHMPVLKKQGLKGLYLTHILKMVHTVILGMMRTTPLTINQTHVVLRSCFRIHTKQ